MNLFGHFDGVVRAVLSDMVKAGEIPGNLDLSKLVVEPPRESAHGDITTNAAMVLAKAAGARPRDLAEILAQHLAAQPDIATAEVAGPGFVNITLKPSFWPTLLKSVLDLGQAYGRSRRGGGTKVNVEYVSANPTGPLHVGHCRGAVYGDALANLLGQTGYDVTREYYINDAGAQVDALARSAYLRYCEALGEDIGEIPSGLYPGSYLKPVGEALARIHGSKLLDQPESEWLETVRDTAIAMMTDEIRNDLAALDIHHDVFFSERSLHQGGIAATVDALRRRGLVYEGRLPPPKGQLPEDWEDREQTLFRATAFGDDMDRPLAKSDGTYTYFAADVAYAYDKIARGFEELVYVLGADHGGYVRRLEAVTAALSDGRVKLVARLCQLVKLYRAGEPVRMSKRAGEFVTLRDVVDEVGADVVRFIMLYRKNDAQLDFDFAKVTEQSRDNPVFYVQYAHARIASVFRNAETDLAGTDLGPSALAGADFMLLDDPGELRIIRRVAGYPRLVEAAAEAHEPHRIAFYLYELASDFHALWNKGKDSPHLRFISKHQLHVTMARLALLCAIRDVLANGLGILGVRPVQEM
ncbi:MAG TPA: arginine--tRNA ligase [Aestuariivirgaceae bacterium]|nr:arginine--tRNA ligase [Aestuariivirgaceae bacterium]